MAALTLPVTVVPGARAIPAVAARRLISAIEILLAFRFTSSCARVGFHIYRARDIKRRLAEFYRSLIDPEQVVR